MVNEVRYTHKTIPRRVAIRRIQGAPIKTLRTKPCKKQIKIVKIPCKKDTAK
jgi:hypothetical protein